MPIRAIEIMEKHTYDADKDGRIEKDALEITLDKLLKGAGPGADPTEIAQFDIYDKFREFIPWVSIDGFTVGGDTGYLVAVYGFLVRVTTAATADYDAYLHSTAELRKLLDAGKRIVFEFPLMRMGAITSVNVWLRLASTYADPPSETAHHFGWKIIGADLYASNADGTTQTITDTGVNLAAGNQRTRLKLVFVPGTDCKFYVNDVLKVTHTTNLPTAVGYYLHLHIRTLDAAVNDVQIGRVLIEKEY